MITGRPCVPDLLRRFVSTPYVLTFGPAEARVCVETNDLEIAQGLHHAYGFSGNAALPAVSYWKLIRDENAPRSEGDPAILLSDPLRMLLAGIGTILVFDRDRHEILGFFAPGATVKQLLTAWIPLLVDTATVAG